MRILDRNSSFLLKIEIEIRHLPDNRVDSTTWFALDDILIQTCVEGISILHTITGIIIHLAQTTTTTTTTTTTKPTTMMTTTYEEMKNSSLIHDRLAYLHGNATQERFVSFHLPLLGFVLYILGTFITLTLIVIFLIIVIFTYRKRCLPPSNSTLPTIDYRIPSRRRKRYHHSGIHNSHIDPDARTERTVVTTIRA